MSLVAQYALASPQLPLTATAASVPEATIELDRLLIAKGDTLVLTLWVRYKAFDAFEEALDRDDTIEGVVNLGAAHEQRLYRVEAADTLLDLELAFLEVGTAPQGGTISPAGWRLRAHFPDRKALICFRNACADFDVSFRLEQLSTSDTPEHSLAGLTAKQREALLLAHERGYFRVPKQVSLEALSNRLEISKTALSARLRRAQQRIIENAVARASI